jgi:lactoylglutathione lyase
VLELTFNRDGRAYELGTGYGHIAVGVDDLEETLAELNEQGIEPEREPYRVREGGSRICFVQDPDGYRTELACIPASRGKNLERRDGLSWPSLANHDRREGPFAAICH